MVEDVIELRPGAKPKKPKDPTNAERSRRFRANKKAAQEAAEKAAQGAATPVATAPTVVQGVAQQPTTVLSLVGRYAAAAIVGAIGIGLAGIGMVETATFALASGGVLFCAQAIGADLLSLVMPTAVAALWRDRWPAAVLAALLWLGGIVVTTSNVAGFVAEHSEEHLASREAGAVERSLVLERLSRLREERKAIVETRPPAAIIAAINDAKRFAQPALREALAVARRRDAIDTELATFEQRLAALPRVSTADASAAVLSAISGATISESLLRKFRLACLLALPLAGGLVLSLAFALAPIRPGARP